MEVTKFRSVLLEPLGSNSGRVGCRITLLELSKFVGMRTEHEWMQVNKKDVNVPATCQRYV